MHSLIGPPSVDVALQDRNPTGQLIDALVAQGQISSCILLVVDLGPQLFPLIADLGLEATEAVIEPNRCERRLEQQHADPLQGQRQATGAPLRRIRLTHVDVNFAKRRAHAVILLA